MNLKPGKLDLVAGELFRATSRSRPTRRAKIICTIGPSCNTEAMLRELMRLGMDVARLNFSHGTHQEHARNIDRLRRAAETGEPHHLHPAGPAGPEDPHRTPEGARAGAVEDGLAGHHHAARRCRHAEPDLDHLPGLAREVRPGARILLSDGLIELRVTRIRGDDVECEVVNGGMLGEHQGINLPGVALSIPALTDKDRDDLEFGLKHGVDMVALVVRALRRRRARA